MSEFKDNYDKLLKELKLNIKDEKKYRKIVDDFNYLLFDCMSRYSDISKLNMTQEKIILVMGELLERVENIEKDIYDETDEDDYLNNDFNELKHCIYSENQADDYEYEVECPFCEHKFIIDSSYEKKNFIKCPKCKKRIDFNWNEDEHENENTYNIDKLEDDKQIAEDDTKYKNKKKKDK